MSVAIDVAGIAIRGLPRREIAAFVRRAIRAVERAGAATREVDEVSIALVGDAEMAALNARFRGKRKTTDVLTFSGDAGFLGEIVISVGQASRQARVEGHSLATEVRYLLLHGVLHAYGWDHETDRGAMNALEQTLRPRLGLE